MKREVSWGVTATVVLAAMIGISTQHGGRPDAQAHARSAAAGQASNAANISTDRFEQGPCVEIENHHSRIFCSAAKPSRVPRRSPVTAI